MAAKGKGKTWRRANPRDVLKRLILENPRVGKRKLLAMFRNEIRGKDGKGYLDSVIDYWFASNQP